MPTLAVGMLETRENYDMPTASVGMAPIRWLLLKKQPHRVVLPPIAGMAIFFNRRSDECGIMFVSAYLFTTYAHGAKVSLGAGIGKILAFFVGLDYNQTYRTCPLCPTI